MCSISMFVIYQQCDWVQYLPLEKENDILREELTSEQVNISTSIHAYNTHVFLENNYNPCNWILEMVKILQSLLEFYFFTCWMLDMGLH